MPGTVIRTGTVKMLESERMYRCSKCKHQFSVRADVEQFYTIPKPARCPSEMDPPCPSTNFTALNVDISRRPSMAAPENIVVGCSRLLVGPPAIMIAQRINRKTAVTSKRSRSKNRSTSWLWAIYPLARMPCRGSVSFRFAGWFLDPCHTSPVRSLWC